MPSCAFGEGMRFGPKIVVSQTGGADGQVQMLDLLGVISRHKKPDLKTG